MSLKIIVDSTFNLDKEFINKNDIYVVPLNVIIGQQNYLDGEITIAEILKFLDNGIKVSSSQPSPQAFANVFEKAKKQGYTEILCLTLSSTLSGTFQSAMLAKREIEGIKIIVFDTLSAALGGEIFVDVAVKEKNNQKSIDEIVYKLEKIRKNSGLLLSLQNLNALKSSGRINKIKATIGNLLRVKAIVELFDGQIHIKSKLRTDSQVFKMIIDKMKSFLDNITTPIHIIVGHISAEKRAKKFINLLQEALPNVSIKFKNGITPVIAINVGYGGIGVAWSYE